MEARQYLNQAIKIDKIINNKIIEREQWQSIAYGTGSRSEGERVQSSGSKQKMADAVIRVIEIEEEIDKYVDKLANLKQDILWTIEQLDASSYDILHKRYIQGLDLLEISEIYGKPIPSIKRKQGKALKKLQAILDERDKRG